MYLLANVLNIVLTLVGVVFLNSGWAFRHEGVPPYVVMAAVGVILSSNGSVMVWDRMRASKRAGRTKKRSDYVLLACGAIVLYEGLAGLQVAFAYASTQPAVAQHAQASAHDLYYVTRCERESAACWYAAAATASTAFGVASVPLMAPRGTFDTAQMHAVLRRATALLKTEASGDAMRAYHTRDRACARSILCSVTLGRQTAKAAASLQQTAAAMALLAERALPAVESKAP